MSDKNGARLGIEEGSRRKISRPISAVVPQGQHGTDKMVLLVLLKQEQATCSSSLSIPGESFTNRCRPPQRYSPPADNLFQKVIAEEQLTGQSGTQVK